MMKIVAGFGALEDYEVLVSAGADELFTGYTPLEWNLKYGNSLPMNRREVLFYHTQIGTFEDMKILSEKVKVYKVPVTIAVNALYYTKEQIEVIIQTIRALCEIGFTDYIVADLNLIRVLVQSDIDCRIHISGEIGQWNTPEMELFNEWFHGEKIKKIIFHRKNSITHVKRCVEYGKEIDFADEYEAFLMNEKCHYTGGFCNSLHCDELVHLCQLEYRMVSDAGFCQNEAEEISFNGEQTTGYLANESKTYIPGETGCGLCALFRMKNAGITHLKLVGRGESAECMTKDIKAVKMALDILEKTETEDKYISTMKSTLFEKGCSGECYYEDIR